MSSQHSHGTTQCVLVHPPSTCIPGNDHARLRNLSTWVEFIYFLLLPLSRIYYRLVFFPNFVSAPYWHVADTPPIKWAERSLRHTDVWYAECACFVPVFFCVSKRRFKFKKKMTQWERLNKRDRKRVTQRTDCDSHITCGYHQEVILVSTSLYLSLFGVWLCPLGRLCSGRWALAALGKAEVELELLVLKSRPSACFRASSLLGTPDTSFHSCCRSDGHIAAGKDTDLT